MKAIRETRNIRYPQHASPTVKRRQRRLVPAERQAARSVPLRGCGNRAKPPKPVTRGSSFGVVVSATFFQSAFVSISRVDAFEKVHQVRPRRVETSARYRGL